MTLEEYVSEVSIDLKRAISGFDNDIRLGIFLALNKHGELSFSGLSEKLGMKMDKSKLDFHLRKLTQSGLVEHHYRHRFGDEKFSFYSTTKFGQNLWNSIVSSLRPPSPIVHMGESSGRYLTEVVKGKLDLEQFASNDNPYIKITAKAKKQTKQEMPEKFSDEVGYEKAVIEAGI